MPRRAARVRITADASSLSLRRLHVKGTVCGAHIRSCVTKQRRLAQKVRFFGAMNATSLRTIPKATMA